MQQSPLTSAGFAYLSSRSFSAATINHFKVGQIGDDRRILHELRRAFGDERLEKCGLMSEGKRGPYLVFPTGYLVFPFFEANEITFLQARRSDDGRTRRWLCPAHLRPPAFSAGAILRGFAAYVDGFENEFQIRRLLEDMLRYTVDEAGLNKATMAAIDPPLESQLFEGIPTGLFVGGFLANVVMLPIDLKVDKILRQRREVAHFRFVDDHEVLAYEFETLIRLLLLCPLL